MSDRDNATNFDKVKCDHGHHKKIKCGDNGTDIELIEKGQVQVDLGGFSGATELVALPLPSAAVGDTIIMNPSLAALTDQNNGVLIWSVRVAAAETVEITITRPDAVDLNASSAQWDYTLIKAGV